MTGECREERGSDDLIIQHAEDEPERTEEERCELQHSSKEWMEPQWLIQHHGQHPHLSDSQPTKTENTNPTKRRQNATRNLVQLG